MVERWRWVAASALLVVGLAVGSPVAAAGVQDVNEVKAGQGGKWFWAI